jgi:hypothetical protein
VVFETEMETVMGDILRCLNPRETVMGDIVWCLNQGE